MAVIQRLWQACLAGLLILVSFVQRLAARWTLPASILFAMMGAVIGSGATLILHSGAGGVFGELAHAFVDLPITADTFMYVFVPALLFQSSLSVDVRGVFDDAAPIFLLAVVAVLVATAVIGVALVPFAGVSIVACLLLASIVATTDSVAVISIFHDVGAPARLCRLVEGESLLNDAAAIVAFTVLLGMLLGQQNTSLASASSSLDWLASICEDSSMSFSSSNFRSRAWATASRWRATRVGNAASAGNTARSVA